MISTTSATSAIVASVGAMSRCQVVAAVDLPRKKPTTAAEVPAISSTTPTAEIPDSQVNISGTDEYGTTKMVKTTTASAVWAREPATGPPERVPTRLSATGRDPLAAECEQVARHAVVEAQERGEGAGEEQQACDRGHGPAPVRREPREHQAHVRR